MAFKGQKYGTTYRSLRAELVRRGMTLDDLAKILGVSRVSIQNRFSGAVEWSLQDCIKIQDALKTDISIDDLFRTD